jgi:hypothetical protein
MSRKRDAFLDDPIVQEMMAELQRLGLRVQAATPEQPLDHIRRLMDMDNDPSGSVH